MTLIMTIKCIAHKASTLVAGNQARLTEHHTIELQIL